MCKSAVLYSKKDYSLSEALRFICREDKVNLIYALTFSELFHHIINSRPEIIFFDEESIPFHYDLYEDIEITKIFDMPTFVILTKDPEKFQSMADDNLLVVNKGNYREKVWEILQKVGEKTAKKLCPEKIEDIKNKTTQLLNNLGVTTKYLGYEYIRELVIDIVKDKRMLKSFNTKLYPKLAIKYNTQVNNIERNIRNAINVAIARCKNKTLFDDICGRSCLHNASAIPSNKQFITWIVDKVS